MENNQTNNSQDTNKDTAPRDWWEEREKWREERWKWRQDRRKARHHWPLHGLFCGLTLILLGVLFLLNQTGAITGDTWWQSFLIGLGGIFIVDGIARYFYPGFPWGVFGKIITGVILVLVGTFLMIGMSEWWPVILIVAGALVMSRFFWRRLHVLP